ncbi:tetratricopeptide repeat protein [Flavobacterium taihuense]|uniref:Tetratricopeptide repeat protein n=1 Tax=Flavobacterium taihuense TaxID=2857508 RepID=A0ABS6XX03_9FLAO|nr:tetratricopeptide repeat protein [Flavobacterium taihuense]MBW4361206.1 tetratricopeptide repeat protein [Flavobacterium taihuense]
MQRKYVLFIILILLSFVAFRIFIVDSYSSKEEKYSLISNEKSTYVGDQSCKECHKAEHKEWKESHHFMSMLPPSEKTVKGNFDNITHIADGVTSRFFKKGNKYFINTEGEDGKNHDYEVKYIFGFTPLQQYLVEFPGGRLQVPRVSWDTKQKKWFNQYAKQTVSSHDWLHWTGNSQNWNTMCASCHSTNLQKKYDDKTNTYKTSYSVINVSCESCHGAGKEHSDYIKNEDYKDGNKIKGSFLKLIKNGNQLEQINTCAPCHARASEISNNHIRSNEIMDNYIPQIPDTENFFADGQIDDEDYIYTSFLQSKMFSKGVKCSNCHNPHSTKLKKIDNQTCLQCHNPQKYNLPTHTFHPVGSQSALCVSCHMPGKIYMGNDLRHDHSFRVPRPDLSEKYGTPNACSSCHQEKSNKYLADAIVKWYGPKRKYHFSDDLIPGSQLDSKSEAHLIKLIENSQTPDIIKATAAFYLGNIQTEPSLNILLKSLKNKDAQVRYRSLRSLSNFEPRSWINQVGYLLSDKVRAVRIAAADLYITIPQEQIPSQHKDAFVAAHKELKKYLHYQTDFSVGNVMLADYYLKLKDYGNAVNYYEKGLKKDSQMNYALLNLSTTYNLQGNNEQALKSLERALKNDSKNARIYYNMALLYNEMSNQPEAEKAFAKAVALKSDNPRVYYNYGLLLIQSKKFKEAEVVLNKGIAINPSAPELYYALTFLYIQTNDTTKAQKAVLQLKQLDPNNPEYQGLFKNMGVY